MASTRNPTVHMRELLYPSNMLTIARFILLPLALYTMRRPEDNRKALVLLGTAMLTDAVDGPIARSRGEVSELGKLLDPIADKLMIDGGAVMLSRYHSFPWWITVALIIRDLVILGGGMLVYRRHRKIVVAHPTGKATTVALTGALLLYLSSGARRGKQALYLASLPFVASLIAYIRSYSAAMRGEE